MPGVASRDLTARDAALAGSDRRSSAGAPRILYVDDEPAMLSIMSRALGGRFQIVTCPDPIEALALLERHKDFAVVISDMRMPQMDGAEFLARVKTLAPHSTRLAFTSCLEREFAPEDDVFGILTKPCSLKLLNESVTLAVQQHLWLTGVAQSAEGETSTTSGLRPLEPELGGTSGMFDMNSSEPQGLSPHGRVCLHILGRHIELGPRATWLGRASTNDIVVDDPRLAPRHARFFHSWRGVTVQDVSGTPGGVRVNGRDITGAVHLADGDTIMVGPFEGQLRVVPE